jgi:hypothetical protein
MTRIIGSLALFAALANGCASQAGDDAATGGYACCAFGPAASLPRCSDVPQEVASRQTVTVVVRNDTTEDRYLITQGQWCTPFSVSALGNSGPTELVLQGYGLADDICSVGGCDMTAPAPTQVVLLRPGESYSLVWDARASAGCLAPITACPDFVRPLSALEPVPAGDYRITAHANVSPPVCDGAFPYAPGCSPGMSAACYTAPTACSSEASASVDFSLPASGDVTVELPLT